MPEGILVVRDAEAPDADAPEPDRFWVIQDNPALSGTDIKNPEQNFDQQGGSEPIVTFDFTDKGREAFQDDHAPRSRSAAPTTRCRATTRRTPPSTSRSCSTTSWSRRRTSTTSENPDGIDGSTGAQISGSFTIPTAQDLAQILEIGALPIRLELVSRSQVSATLGAQALDQGLVAGLAGFVIVALFLIGFYRVLGVIAVDRDGDLRRSTSTRWSS